MCCRGALFRAIWERATEESFAPHRPEQPVSAQSNTLHSSDPVSPHTEDTVPDSLEDNTSSFETSTDTARSVTKITVSQMADGSIESSGTPSDAASNYTAVPSGAARQMQEAPEDALQGILSSSPQHGSDIKSVAGARNEDESKPIHPRCTADSLEGPAAPPVSPGAAHPSEHGASPLHMTPSAQDKQWAEKALMEGSAFSDVEGAESEASGYALLNVMLTPSHSCFWMYHEQQLHSDCRMHAGTSMSCGMYKTKMYTS